MAKPVFVTKQARETIAEREKLALEEMAAKEEAKKRASARVVRMPDLARCAAGTVHHASDLWRRRWLSLGGRCGAEGDIKDGGGAGGSGKADRGGGEAQRAHGVALRHRHQRRQRLRRGGVPEVDAARSGAREARGGDARACGSASRGRAARGGGRRGAGRQGGATRAPSA